MPAAIRYNACAMFLATVLFAAALQTCPSYTGPSDGAIHVCGHAYKLSCSLSGSLSPCQGSSHAPADVSHFEVRDEDGRTVFERNVSGEQRFTDVGISNTGYPEHPQLFTVAVEQRTNSNRESSVSFAYYFHATAAGLVAFQPALSCGDGSATMLANPDLWPPSGLALACKFDAGYLRFTAALQLDFDRHQIVPSDKALRVSDPQGSAKFSAAAENASTLGLYRQHDKSAPQFTLGVSRGQTTRLLAAWEPVSLRSSGDISTVSFDPAKLWLEIETKNERGWIRGVDSFRAIGLREAAK